VKTIRGLPSGFAALRDFLPDWEIEAFGRRDVSGGRSAKKMGAGAPGGHSSEKTLEHASLEHTAYGAGHAAMYRRSTVNGLILL
jgi:hypothetical protein